MLALARIYIDCGELAPAARYLAEALGTSRKLGHRSIVQCLDVMIGLAVKLAAWEKATLFRGACQQLREITGMLATPWEAEQSRRYWSECPPALGDEVFAARESARSAMSTESVIAMGFEWLGSIAESEPVPSVDPIVKASDASGTRGFAA